MSIVLESRDIYGTVSWLGHSTLTHLKRSCVKSVAGCLQTEGALQRPASLPDTFSPLTYCTVSFYTVIRK